MPHTVTADIVGAITVLVACLGLGFLLGMYYGMHIIEEIYEKRRKKKQIARMASDLVDKEDKPTSFDGVVAVLEKHML